jgi:hypothetical protein
MKRCLAAFLLVPAVAVAQQPGESRARPPVSGFVYDSVAGRPLRGANVQLTGAADSVIGRSLSAVTDDEGRFTLRDVPPGRYLAGFFHPVLDSMGIEGVPVTVTVAPTETAIELATPSQRTIIGVICGEAAVADSIGLLLGHVHDTRTGQPLTGARVTAEWSETIIQRRDLRMQNVSHAAGTIGPGWFALCDVPGGVELTVSAASGADSSGYVNIELPRGGLRYSTFYVGAASRVPSAIVDTITPVDSAAPPLVAEMIWRGEARFTGVVRDENGQPVPSARVFVRGTNLSTTTSDRGYFSLEGLPGGTHSYEVRALGYLPATSVVHLAPGRPVNEEIFIGDRAVTLETVRVQATLVFSRNLARFQTNRERNSGGTFIGPREIDRYHGMRFSNLLMGVPGVRLSYANGFSVLMDYRGTDDGQSSGLCVPSIYLDGQRSQYTGAEIEGLYRADELAGVEVYQRYSMRPSEFQDPSSNCGAIVIWTRPQLRRPGGAPPPR